MTLDCELFKTRPAGFLQGFSTFVWLNPASLLLLLLPPEGSVQWKRIGGGIRQFDKVDSVSRARFQRPPSLPGSARSSPVSIRSTCVQGCEGRLTLVVQRDVQLCSTHSERTVHSYGTPLSRCCTSAWMDLCGLLQRVERKWLVQMENSRHSSISINTSLSSPAPLEHGLSPF